MTARRKEKLKQKKRTRKKQISLEAETQRKEKGEGCRCGFEEGDDSDPGMNRTAAEYKPRKKGDSGIRGTLVVKEEDVAAFVEEYEMYAEEAER
ncbi:hypothetical protein WR25_22278 [Diploscapter pachys]|uniref:Uncharacterized protein n=1 Tax=Diploscapter pachys TaxID=2018661 RepID=A0A2A2L5P6_9BILA|nr:hypothetical protein WR25_22278 [Diploscapter pachys]